MAQRILRFPNPKLRLKAKLVKKITPAIVKLIDEMIKTMHAAPGVGLAAPQVGKSLRMIVVDVGPGPIALVNPELMEKSGCQTFTEGCLSLPGVEAPIERAALVRVRGLDREGQEIVVTAEGLLATVFQHEIDHLDGFVFIDRVKDPSTITYVPRHTETKKEMI